MKGEYCGTGELKIDGSLLKGTFKDGWLVDGTHTLPGGTEFSGKPDEGSWSGDGLAVQYAGGAKYSGELLAGLPHGAGHLSQPKGTESPPPPPRTKWTRRVPHPVLIGHAASLTPY